MADAFAAGGLAIFVLMLLFFIPAVIGVTEGSDKGQRSIWADWCVGMFILVAMTMMLAVFATLILGLGYLILWLV